MARVLADGNEYIPIISPKLAW
jgi:hypothetical protein